MPSRPTSTEPGPSELAALATAVAEQAATLLRDGQQQAVVAVATKSSLTDMVTEVDEAAERLITDLLLEARPDDGLLGEEGAARAGTSGVRWVVDPIDGTTNYLYGLPAYAVSIAAERDGRAVAAAVVDVARAETFTASVGGGAACNGRPIRCRPATVLSSALVGTGFSYEPDRRRRQAAVLTSLLPEVRDIRRFGAAAIDLCWVGSGRLDAFYERGLQPWDLAGGCLVATEAGAITGDLDGGPPSTTFTLAATPEVFEPLRHLLNRAGAATA